MLDLITKFDEEEAKIYYESDNHINCDKEIERLKNELNYIVVEKREREIRIDKAIEYIEKDNVSLIQYKSGYGEKDMKNYVLEILKGSDKE